MDDLATILEQARRLRTAAERRQFLESACRGDADMRRRLERMLDDAAEAEAFFGETETNSSGENPNASDGGVEGPGATVGRYKLLQKLGEGGFGIVYMAEQKEPVKRRVALKIIKLGMDTGQVVARFEAERQALALMDHPNIAKVLDAGATERGRPFFVMELIQGVPITRYCDDNRLTTRERLELFIPVCQAVQHAHQKGVIHRDLKPSNILVTLHDGVPVPKVIDFGIAKATQQELTGKTLFTQYGQFIGTPVYMSPEQAEMSGLDIDTRSDIYSLGVVLYELLVGRTPLDARKLLAGGFDEIRRRIKEDEVLKPSTRVSTLDGAELTTIAGHRRINPAQLRGELSGDLDWIVLKALEKDRTRRYETSSAFALDIRHYLGNEPVSAVAPNAAYLLRKYARRHRAALMVTAVMAGSLVAATAVSTWQAFRATQAKKTAETAREAETQARQLEEEEKTIAQRQLYVARMNLIQAAWEQNNVGRVKDLLALTAGSPSHGFEWYYWQRQVHADRRTLWGHTGWINQLAYSPDGTWIVTVSTDKTARIWDVASGKELRILKGHRDWVMCVAVSPDGRRIATGSANDHGAGECSVRVWDSATGEEVLKFTAHTAGVNCVAFSPDGKRIASGGGSESPDMGDRTVRVWEAATGKELLKFTGHTDRVTQVRFSPDGRQIVSCSNPPDGGDAPPRILKVWDATTMQEVLTFKSGDDSIAGFAFVPEGLRVVTSNTSGLAKVWDPAGQKELLTLHGHKVRVACVAFSRDGRWIATGSDDQTARLWDATNGKELQLLRGHSTAINSITFSPSDRQVATAGGDWSTPDNRTARIWDVAGVANPLTISQLTTRLSAVAFSPDGRSIVTTSGNDRMGGTVVVWDTSDGHKLLDLIGHTDRAEPAAFSPDGQRIVTGSADRTARVWDSNTGRGLLTLVGHRSDVWGAVFTPDGKQVITSSLDGLIKVWDAVSGRPLLSIRGNLSRVWAVALSRDGRRIAAGGDLGAGIWDATTGKALFQLKGLNQTSVSVAFSPDDRRLFTGLANGAKVWDATTGDEPLSFKGHGSQVWSADYSPDGRRIVTGSYDTTAKVWDAMTGEEVLTLAGHDAQIRGVAFSPDGQSIATASWDKTVKIWRSAAAQQVDAWTREEKEGEEYVSRQLREEAAKLDRTRAGRAQDAAAIKQWLVLAPVPYEGRDGLAALKQELIPGEANLRPLTGDRVKVGPGDLVWKAVTGDTDLMDFHNSAGIDVVDLRSAPGNSAYDYAYAVAYAVTYVESDARQTNLMLEVTSSHQSKLYLNGDEVYAKQLDSHAQLSPETVAGVTLQAGLNVVVFKVVNTYGGWAGSVHFTDAAGQPLKGIRVTLESKASMRPK